MAITIIKTVTDADRDAGQLTFYKGADGIHVAACFRVTQTDGTSDSFCADAKLADSLLALQTTGTISGVQAMAFSAVMVALREHCRTTLGGLK